MTAIAARTAQGLRPGRWCAALVCIVAAACAPKGDALYQRAEQGLAEGKLGQALVDVRNLVESEPRNAKARALLARAILESGDLQGAGIELGKAREYGAAAGSLLGTQCLLWAGQGETDKVLAECQAAKADAGARADVLVARGEMLLTQKRGQEAFEAFQAATQADPDHLGARLGMAAVAAQSGDLDRARTLLDGSPAAMHSRSGYQQTLGQIEVLAGNLPEAEKAFAAAATAAESGGDTVARVQALVDLADIQVRQNRVTEAKATASRLTQAGPNNPFLKTLRAQVDLAAGDLEEARTLLEGVLSSRHDDTRARLLLGLVNLRQGNFGQAEMNFASVVATEPDNVQAQRLLAETRVRVQSPQVTLEGLKPALAQNPDPSLLAMAGRLSLAAGDREQALAYLSQATAQPDASLAPDVQMEVAAGFAAAGAYDRAIELLRALPPSGPGAGYQREYLLINALLRKGDKDGASAEGQALLQRAKNDPAAQNLVAAALSATGQRDAGREQYLAALKARPDDVATLLNLARLDLAEGRTVEADGRFRRILEIDPKNLAATLGAASAAGAGGDKLGTERWLSKAVADHPDSIDANASLAQFHLRNGDTARAKAVLDSAVKKSPRSAPLANLRGLVLLASGDGPGAIRAMTDATTFAPNEPQYVMNLARARQVTGDVKGALATLDDLLAGEPKNVLALQLAAAVALRGQQPDRAVGYIDRLRQAAPDAPATDRLTGDLAMAQKRYKDALDAYRRAGMRGKDLELVLAEYQAGRLSGAADPVKGVEEWVATHPQDAAAVLIVAQSKLAAGNQDAAIQLYEQGLAGHPDNVAMLNNLAVLYQAKGDSRALETARRAHALMPQSGAVTDTYAWILVEAGRAEDALPLLKSAVAAEPRSAEIRFHYASALAAAGQGAQALTELRQALAGELTPAVRTDAQKLLKQLSK